ncbi:MAG: hypothetical protein ACTSQC_01990 [Candidatus Heimdallarchaeaceae archaeon]
MPKEDLKSLVNSVNMLKNMVESIVAAVQERFKDYDNVVVTLKERLDNLESSSGSVPTTPSGSISSDITARTETLEKRLDTLNERLLFIETAKGEVVEALPTLEPEIKEEVESVITEAPPTPAPVPEIIETLKDFEEPVVKEERDAVQPIAGVSSIPTPGAIPTPAPTPEPEGTIGVPTPAVEVTAPPTEVSVPAPTPASQITEATERDVSPISKQVSGAIPTPPAAEETIQPETEIQPPAPKAEEVKPPEEGKSAELFGEAVSGDKAELLKALKKLEDL